MPYIPQEDERPRLDPIIRQLTEAIQSIVGEKGLDLREADGRLNYTICELLMKTLRIDSNPRYTRINTLLGVLSGVENEIYDRVVRPYEDLAIKENGDISSFEEFRKTLERKRNG